LKLTSGTNLTTTEAGAIEYDGTHLYFTAANAGTRFQLDQQVGANVMMKNASNTMTVTGRILYPSSQSAALVAARANGVSFEFGHTNSSGYGSTIGAEGSSGNPFIAFSAEPGASVNTYLTRGIVGNIIRAVNGTLQIGRAANASLDSQAFTSDFEVTPTQTIVRGAFSALAAATITGNVGIGTAAPGTRLEVQVPSGTVSNAIFSGLQATNTTGHYIVFNGGVAAATARGYLGYAHTGSGIVSLWTNEVADYMGLRGESGVQIGSAQSTPEMTITAGNVGIGTTAPVYKLDVAGDVNVTGNFKINGVNAVAGNDASALTTGTLPDARLSANVPRLNAANVFSGGNQSITSATDVTGLSIQAVTTARPTINFLNATTGALGLILATNTKDLVFNTNGGGTSAMTLYASGGAFIGSTPSDPGAGNLTTSGVISTLGLYATGQVQGDSGGFTSVKVTGGTLKITSLSSCALSVDAFGTIICTSDINLKQNSRPFTLGLNAIMGINPEYFQYTGETYTHAGFIAQNVQTVIPEATPLQGNGFLGLDTNAILAASVNAIKELNLIVDNLQGKAPVSSLPESLPSSKRLCVSDEAGETCLTRPQLDALIAGVARNSVSPTPSPAPTPAPQPIPEIVPVPEPSIIPLPEPVPALPETGITTQKKSLWDIFLKFFFNIN
jgi:hypothetical protein